MFFSEAGDYPLTPSNSCGRNLPSIPEVKAWDGFGRIPVTAHSSRSSAYTRWIPFGMPFLGQYQPLLKSVFFLYPSKKDAENGKQFGGTGFVVGIPSERWGFAHTFYYGVTNYHVAVRPESGKPSPVIRFNGPSGIADIKELDEVDWEFKPGGHDVAVVPLELDRKVCDAESIGPSSIFTRGGIDKAKISAGDDIFMIGRFLDYDGKETNQPAMRFGNISILSADIRMDHPLTGHSIVLDMHSRAGFSGSPVFVYRTAGSVFKPAGVPIDAWMHGHMLELLGIHWGQFPDRHEISAKKTKGKQPSRLASEITEGFYVKGLSGMTCAAPVSAIWEVLDMPKLKRLREKKDDDLADEMQDRPISESSSPPATDENPNHREDFMRLVNVAARKREQKD